MSQKMGVEEAKRVLGISGTLNSDILFAKYSDRKSSAEDSLSSAKDEMDKEFFSSKIEKYAYYDKYVKPHLEEVNEIEEANKFLKNYVRTNDEASKPVSIETEKTPSKQTKPNQSEYLIGIYMLSVALATVIGYFTSPFTGLIALAIISGTVLLIDSAIK